MAEPFLQRLLHKHTTDACCTVASLISVAKDEIAFASLCLTGTNGSITTSLNDLIESCTVYHTIAVTGKPAERHGSTVMTYHRETTHA